MKEMQEVVILETQHGSRLDKALSELINLSRHHTAMLIKADCVLDAHNRPVRKASYIVQTGMILKILPIQTELRVARIDRRGADVSDSNSNGIYQHDIDRSNVISQNDKDVMQQSDLAQQRQEQNIYDQQKNQNSESVDRYDQHASLSPYSYNANIIRPIQIIYEDDFILIADKPHGQPSHPSAGHPTNTLLDAAIEYFQRNNIRMSTFNGQPALINRLDMDTSGLILIAKDDAIHNHIKQQFSDRSTVKMYKARVHNAEKLPEDFCLEGYIGPSTTKKDLMHVYDARMYKSTPAKYADLQHALQSKKQELLTKMINANERMIVEDADTVFAGHIYHKFAQTAYKYAFMECMKSYSPHDKSDTILCFPHTGRQHQIRVQLLGARAPILGDPLYAKDDFAPLQLRSVFINFFHFQKKCFLSIYNP